MSARPCPRIGTSRTPSPLLACGPPAFRPVSGGLSLGCDQTTSLSLVMSVKVPLPLFLNSLCCNPLNFLGGQTSSVWLSYLQSVGWLANDQLAYWHT